MQLPGREQRFREARFTRLEPLVSALLPAIQPHLDLPYVIFGHSMGVLIAFELTQRLARMRERLPLLFISSGRPAPHVRDREPPIHHLPETKFCAATLNRYFTPKLQECIDDRELRTLFLPQLRADLELSENYVYRDAPPLDCPVFAIAGTEETQIAVGQLEAWSTHTTRGAKCQRFPGGHFFIQSCEAEVVAAINREINAVLPAMQETRPLKSGRSA